jgi:predicted acylesterase/phospholipase RssA
VRASSAVPGIVSPVGIDGVEYEDGDESLPLAVQAARQAGAQFVIAVNVYPRETPASASSKQRARDERRRRLMASIRLVRLGLRVPLPATFSTIVGGLIRAPTGKPSALAGLRRALPA